MEYTVFAPSHIKMRVQLPASKSISNRVLILNALADSQGKISNISDCDDTKVMLQAFASVEKIVNIGAAGTAMRFLTAYFSSIEGERIITGTERMKNRPIRLLVDALRQIGAKIDYIEKEGYPPLKISGTTLSGGEIFIDGNISSQYISALMMVSPVTQKGLTIHLQGNIISRPYIHLTKKLMEMFGVAVHWDDHTIQILPQTYKSVDFIVENDWSASSYWYQMAALSENSEIELLGLFSQSYQGDSKVAGLFEQLGVATSYTPTGITLSKKNHITDKFVYNFIDEPDLAQTFAVTCALMEIPFRFEGLQSLKIKETDRIEALKTEMKKLGYILKDLNDSVLEWNGERCAPVNEPIKTYEDHRMAMAFAPVALKSGSIKIDEPQVVTKSYPNYWENLKEAGFEIIEN